jgi:hypothetical protein
MMRVYPYSWREKINFYKNVLSSFYHGCRVEPWLWFNLACRYYGSTLQPW